MAPKITNEVLEVKIDSIKEKLDNHNEEEQRVFSNIHSILERMDGRVDNIDLTLAKQHIVLEDHIRRTEALEATVTPLKTKGDALTIILKIAIAIAGAGAGSLGIKELLSLLAS